MTVTLNGKVYKAFGFNVMSEIPLPELPWVYTKKEIDILIEFADLTEIWAEVNEPNRYFYIDEGSVLFQIPNIATFIVQDGYKILVSPLRDATEDYLRLYILGTCMGAILLQRKILPLHGSAIEVNGKAYLIVGDSGAGKSTLASALINRGKRLITDDVIPVTLTAEGIPMVTPSYPQQKLWQESLNQFGISSEKFRPIVDRETKFAVPVSDKFATDCLPLAGVFELIKSNSVDINLTPILHLERLHTLYYHTYRNFMIGPLGLMEWHFKMTAAIIHEIKIYQLQRPEDRFTADELTSLVLNTIERK
ncbi:HPr kinase/phosphorylase [Bacillus dakarensis]|uniref:HPr kinase/phosphorylase n=1 Tax=Robertmurraya dakarensis TaxID=1926278 RepID=UPI000981642A|nr:aldolase [Bacillus dakarensis]